MMKRFAMPNPRAAYLLLGVMLSLTAPARAQAPADYTAPKAFMDLFFDFTGSGEPDYPAGQPTVGQMLTQSAAAREGKPGPLVLVEGSDIYTILRPATAWDFNAFVPIAPLASTS
jgi:hypothetical protein